MPERALELTDAEIRGVLVEAANGNAAAMNVFRRLLLLEAVPDEEFAIGKPR